MIRPRKKPFPLVLPTSRGGNPQPEERANDGGDRIFEPRGRRDSKKAPPESSREQAKVNPGRFTFPTKKKKKKKKKKTGFGKRRGHPTTQSERGAIRRIQAISSRSWNGSGAEHKQTTVGSKERGKRPAHWGEESDGKGGTFQKEKGWDARRVSQKQTQKEEKD